MDYINVFVLCYIVLHYFAVIQTVGGRSKQARVTLFASMSPVLIWKKAMTVASTALLFLMEVNFSPSINTSLMSLQAIVLGVGVGVVVGVVVGLNYLRVGVRKCLLGRKDWMVQCLLYTSSVVQPTNELTVWEVDTLNTMLICWRVPHL